MPTAPCLDSCAWLWLLYSYGRYSYGLYSCGCSLPRLMCLALASARPRMLAFAWCIVVHAPKVAKNRHRAHRLLGASLCGSCGSRAGGGACVAVRVRICEVHACAVLCAHARAVHAPSCSGLCVRDTDITRIDRVIHTQQALLQEFLRKKNGADRHCYRLTPLKEPSHAAALVAFPGATKQQW